MLGMSSTIKALSGLHVAPFTHRGTIQITSALRSGPAIQDPVPKVAAEGLSVGHLSGVQLLEFCHKRWSLHLSRKVYKLC